MTRPRAALQAVFAARQGTAKRLREMTKRCGLEITNCDIPVNNRQQQLCRCRQLPWRQGPGENIPGFVNSELISSLLKCTIVTDTAAVDNTSLPM